MNYIKTHQKNEYKINNKVTTVIGRITVDQNCFS